jgi:hypothetical protein
MNPLRLVWCLATSLVLLMPGCYGEREPRHAVRYEERHEDRREEHREPRHEEHHEEHHEESH